MEMRDLLGGFVRDHDLDRVYLLRGRPVEAPWRMALVTVLQFREGLSDRQAADAVRSRIDWTCALSLELTDPGFDYSVLSEFRTRLVERGDGEERAFGDRLLREARWRPPPGCAPTRRRPGMIATTTGSRSSACPRPRRRARP